MKKSDWLLLIGVVIAYIPIGILFLLLVYQCGVGVRW